jgi:glycosyltransferase involved in cell wall biosynthesis
MHRYSDFIVREEIGMLTNAKTKTVDAKWQEGQRGNLAELLFHEQRVVKISAVIPTLNEEKNLIHVLPNIQHWVDEVILVDGHSSDETVAVARELCPAIRVLMQEGRGKGAALRTGFAAATGDIIVMLDADGSTDPSEIPLFVGALLSGADFAKGSRFLQGGGTADMPFYRKLGNWGFVLIVRLAFGGKYTDLCYGYNAFWKRVLPFLDLDCNGFEVETMMNVRALKSGLQITEVPSFEAARVYGIGRLKTIPDGWRVLKTIFREIANRRKWISRPARATGRTRLADDLHGVSGTRKSTVLNTDDK